MVSNITNLKIGPLNLRQCSKNISLLFYSCKKIIIMSNQHRFDCSDRFYRIFHKWPNGLNWNYRAQSLAKLLLGILFSEYGIFGEIFISDIFWRPFSWLHEHYHRVTSALLEQGAKINDFTFGSPFYGFCYI